MFLIFVVLLDIYGSAGGGSVESGSVRGVIHWAGVPLVWLHRREEVVSRQTLDSTCEERKIDPSGVVDLFGCLFDKRQEQTNLPKYKEILHILKVDYQIKL